MKKISFWSVLGRIISFIPILVLITYSTIKLWCMMSYNLLVYGSEIAVYNNRMNRTTIVDVFNRLNDILDEKRDKKVVE